NRVDVPMNSDSNGACDRQATSGLLRRFGLWRGWFRPLGYEVLDRLVKRHRIEAKRLLVMLLGLLRLGGFGTHGRDCTMNSIDREEIRQTCDLPAYRSITPRMLEAGFQVFELAGIVDDPMGA